MTPEQEAGLRAWARGSLPQMAGVELLIRSRLLAGKLDTFLFNHDRDPEVPRGMVWPDLDGFAEANAGYLSSGEAKVFGVAYTLAHPGGKGRVDLADLQGINTEECVLILAAVAHCMGLHERAGGSPVPWPES